MQRLSSFAFLAALASLSLGGCKSDDAGGSNAPQQPGIAAAAAPGEEPEADSPGDRRRGARRAMSPDQRRAERLRRFDTNGDGKLDREERKVMIREAVERRMRRMDGNQDGRIARDEVRGGRFGEHLAASFDRADANRDSYISPQELEAAMADFRAKRQAERLQQQSGGAAPAPAAPQGGAPPPVEDDLGDDSLDE